MNASFDGTMNNWTEGEYWDQLDHPHMACNPSNPAQGYEFVCAFTTRFAASMYLVNGLCFFIVAQMKTRLLSSSTHGQKTTITNSAKRGGNFKTRSQEEGVETWSVFRKSERLAKALEGVRNPNVRGALLLGASTWSSSFAFFIAGSGTALPTSSTAGLVADAFAGLQFWTASCLALLQLRGALWFHSLVTLQPGHEKPKSWIQRLPSGTHFLDTIQGPLSIAIYSLLWCLLVAGVLPRAWYYVIMTTLSLIWGLRSFVAITTKRISALRKVAAIQQQVRGTEYEKKRRRSILKNKKAALAVDMATVFAMSVCVPGSYLVFNSYFSSRRLAQHYTAAQVLAILGLTLLNVQMFSSVKAKKKRMRENGERKAKQAQTVCESMPSTSCSV